MMRLPPATAKALFAAFLLVSVGAVALDLVVANASAHHAQQTGFSIQTDNWTVVGTRITNAGPGERVETTELWSNAACGIGFGSPVEVLVESTDANNTTRNSTVTIWRRHASDPGSNETSAPMHLGGNATLRFNVQTFFHAVLRANVSMYVVESRHTPALLMGHEVPVYQANHRNGSQFMCFRELGALNFERSDAVGTSDGPSFGEAPWVDELPFRDGIDIVYVIREEGNNATAYDAVARDLQSASHSWPYLFQPGVVRDPSGAVPERLLRATAMAGLVAAAAMLPFMWRRPAPATSLVVRQPMEAAVELANAGERHLKRLERTWALVGALLLPIAAGATAAVAVLAGDIPAPVDNWMAFVVGVLAGCGIGLLLLWLDTWRQVRNDLAAWRAAWARLQSPLDGF